MRLLPPSVHEFVLAGHLAHVVQDFVRESLDVSTILRPYTEDRRYPSYDPTMMVALRRYGHCPGLYASRRIAKACDERVDRDGTTAARLSDRKLPLI